MDHSYAKQKLSLLVRDIANYTDDEFRRQMARIVRGATGQDIPDDCHEIKAERDALAAQVDLLRLAVLSAVQKISGGQTKADLRDAYDATPEQCLAEIKAEACRAGFIAGACGVLPVYSTMELADIEADARNYAAKIRNTGTWLRDENVNGGKRQGHCKCCLDKVYQDDDYKVVDNKLYHSKCYNHDQSNQGGEK